MDQLPNSLKLIILKQKDEIEHHIKYKKCINQINKLTHYVDNDITSTIMISNSKYTNYFIENNGDLWIYKYVGSHEYISIIHHNIINVIINNIVLHSL